MDSIPDALQDVMDKKMEKYQKKAAETMNGNASWLMQKIACTLTDFGANMTEISSPIGHSSDTEEAKLIQSFASFLVIKINKEILLIEENNVKNDYNLYNQAETIGFIAQSANNYFEAHLKNGESQEVMAQAFCTLRLFKNFLKELYKLQGKEIRKHRKDPFKDNWNDNIKESILQFKGIRNKIGKIVQDYNFSDDINNVYMPKIRDAEKYLIQQIFEEKDRQGNEFNKKLKITNLNTRLNDISCYTKKIYNDNNINEKTRKNYEQLKKNLRQLERFLETRFHYTPVSEGEHYDEKRE